jgi:hypothetical protein
LFFLLIGMEYFDARRKPHNIGKVMKVIAALVLVALCVFVLKQSPGFGGNSVVRSPCFLPFSLINPLFLTISGSSSIS